MMRRTSMHSEQIILYVYREKSLTALLFLKRSWKREIILFLTKYHLIVFLHVFFLIWQKLSKISLFFIRLKYYTLKH